MFKKFSFIYLLIFSLFLIFPFSKVNALTLKDGTLVDETNAHLYISENIDNIPSYSRKDYFLTTKSINYTISGVLYDNILTIFYFTEYNSVSEKAFYIENYNYFLYDIDRQCFFYRYNATEVLNENSIFVSYSSNAGNNYIKYVDVINSSLSLIYNDVEVLQNNWQFSNKLKLTFTSNVDDYNLILKDSDNNVININEDNSYTLIKGNTYTYVAIKEDYKKIEESITISENTTINLNFELIIDKTSINSIFSSFTSNYINFLSIIYDNVIFLFLVSIILIFSIILLIKKLF